MIERIKKKLTIEEKLQIIEDTQQHYRNEPFGFDTKSNICVYYNSRNGARCAIGRLAIPDPDQASDQEKDAWALLDGTILEAMEDYDLHSDVVADFLVSLAQEDAKFYQKLQNAHDDAARGRDNIEFIFNAVKALVLQEAI